MVAFSTKYMLRSILAAFKRRRKKSLARETKTFWRKKGFPGRKTPFAKPFSAFQKLRAAPEIATIYLEQVIKQNDWTLLHIGRHFCLWFYGRARAKEIWALDNRLTNQTKVPFVLQEGVMNSSARPTRALRPSWRHDKRSAQMQKHFETGVVFCGETQCLQAVFPAHFSFKWFCVRIQISNHDLSYLRGKWILILAKQSFVKFIWRGFVGALEWRVVWENFPCSHGKFAFFWRSVRWRNLKRDLKIGYL